MASRPLTLAFMGTPPFAVPTLEALVAAGHRVAAVYTQPPRPSGRRMQPTPSAVHEAAQRLGLPVETPASLKDAAVQARWASLGLDAAVVAAYGLILPRPILAAPRLGCLNVHASLLPRWRGAAPVQRAILAGDAETGVTIMRMEAGLDTGPMLLAERTPIATDDTAGSLTERLAEMGAALLVRALAALPEPMPQPADGVTYAAKIAPAEAALDWTQPAVVLDRTVRAFAPRPGAWATIGGERVKVLAAEPLATSSGPAGTLLDAQFTIACGEGALRLLRVQRPGRGPLDAAEALRGMPLAPGDRLA